MAVNFINCVDNVQWCNILLNQRIKQSAKTPGTRVNLLANSSAIAG